jgi:hypothetical protein
MGTFRIGRVNCVGIQSMLQSEPRKAACERVASVFPGCRCESESVVPCLSPGVVGPAENLARFVADHDLDHETNEVKPSLFSHAGTNGMSVTRIEHAGTEALANQQSSGGYRGYVFASCESIRELAWEGERLFAIYDTAQAENYAHADVCQAVLRPRSRVSEMRRKLQLAFTRSPLPARQ